MSEHERTGGWSLTVPFWVRLSSEQTPQVSRNRHRPKRTYARAPGVTTWVPSSERAQGNKRDAKYLAEGFSRVFGMHGQAEHETMDPQMVDEERLRQNMRALKSGPASRHVPSTFGVTIDEQLLIERTKQFGSTHRH